MYTQPPVATSPIRADKRRLGIALYALVILTVVAGLAALGWMDTLPQRVDDRSTGQSQAEAGSRRPGHYAL